MVSRLRASVVVIGDEILDGYVADTNSGWIAARLRRLGVPLDRVVTVPDELAAIMEALAAELSRQRPRVVLTSGGIGSTPDDRTMEAVAAYLGVDLVVEPQLDGGITDLVRRAARTGMRIDADQERALRRMTLVPDGSRLLAGVSGVAPGVVVDIDGGCGAGDGATVVVLPGIPSELQRIVSDSVEPQLLAGRGTPHHVEEVTHPYPESMLTPLLERLAADYPEVAIGSYPGAECVVRLKGPADRVRAALTEVRRRLEELRRSDDAQRASDAWQARWSDD